MKKKPLRQGALGRGGFMGKGGGSHKMLEGKETIVLEEDDKTFKILVSINQGII